jgi:hypothetical protein
MEDHGTCGPTRHYGGWIMWRMMEVVCVSQLSDMVLETGKDFLVVYDGQSPADPVLIRFSGIFDGSQMVISSRSSVYVYFFSNYAVTAKGFNINYRAGARAHKCHVIFYLCRL